ncbi:hypothetical protein ARMSODRAFT_1018250 [Armillaria solidipes]|uniref:Uncharacterized protein n=1 Tax=Armillaria solidipes TaxID=1076256 RepID=A0A2H3BML1_9AGAR|nr:hypothetical protein ARMSODRAFT_1018250 [Armillaria solidipes]
MPGTKPTLIKNAKIWTGLHNGTQVPEADILIDKGLLVGVGCFGYTQLEAYGSSLEVVDAHGAIRSLQALWTTILIWGTAQPWLRSLDGLNTHDVAYPLSIAGVTTALILPSSADSIGIRAFSATKMAAYETRCGENPICHISLTESAIDTTWAYREAYNTAFQIKRKQNASCSKAMSGQWQGLLEYPEHLKWEALVDVIRGHVKDFLATHQHEKYPDFEYDADKDQLEGEDVFMLDGDNALPEAVPDVEDGADEPTSQWEGDEVYKDEEPAAVLPANGLKECDSHAAATNMWADFDDVPFPLTQVAEDHAENGKRKSSETIDLSSGMLVDGQKPAKMLPIAQDDQRGSWRITRPLKTSSNSSKYLLAFEWSS